MSSVGRDLPCDIAVRVFFLNCCCNVKVFSLEVPQNVVSLSLGKHYTLVVVVVYSGTSE